MLMHSASSQPVVARSLICSPRRAPRNQDANFGAAINKAINFKATLPDLATLSKGLERIRITGTGAASKVHLAKHRGTGALYVIKQFSTNAYQTEEALRSIAEEMRIAAAPGVHPNLVRFIDAGIEPGETTGDPSRVFVTLEYCDGGNLEKILQACDHSVPPAPLRGIALQICHGLRYLHQELRQTHRDLKPANILFTFQGAMRPLSPSLGLPSSSSLDLPLILPWPRPSPPFPGLPLASLPLILPHPSIWHQVSSS